MIETTRGVTESGLFEIEANDYHADPCPMPSLSNSLLKPLLNLSPKHAWTVSPRLNPHHVPDESERLDFGSIVHRILLDKGRQMQILDFPDYRTKAAQQARDTAREIGRIPVLVEKYEQAQRLATRAREQIRQFPDMSDAFDTMTGKTEIGLFWEDDAGCWGRSLIDRLMTDAPFWRSIDIKTIARSARPDDAGLGVHFTEMGYDTQAALQERGLIKVFPKLAGRILFRFVFIELDPPHMISIVEPDPATMEIARRKVDAGFRLWSRCLKRNYFPGYPCRVVPLRHAEWMASRWLEREGLETAPDAARPDPVENPVAQDQGWADIQTVLDAG
jgi:PDDEXK-like domain of unknown function (DUF3799)